MKADRFTVESCGGHRHSGAAFRPSTFSFQLSTRARLRDTRAFALIITLTLLAFLVLLLVGLATFTKVETQISDNTTKQAQARQNALMALNIALGQLQKYAGPDTRVTATAEAFGGSAGTRHYTGVWDSAATGSAPLAWLASGASSPGVPPSNAVELVGSATSVANDVLAAKEPISANSVPGVSSSTTIGNYAWWVGDQGVKADISLSDRTAEVNYGPFSSQELSSRLRQQIGVGSGPADANGNPVFEPRDTTNTGFIERVLAPTQIAFLQTPAGAAVGSGFARQYFNSWTVGSYGVLADVTGGGLRQDLSLQPELLGAAFAAWTNYATSGVMESPSSPNSPSPAPAYDTTTPVRRRYFITAPSAGSSNGVAPVLTYFYIILGVRKQNASSPYTLGLRWAAALWNPYTSALVPEDLRLEISGLPSSVAIKARASTAPMGSGSTDVIVSLAGRYGTPMKVKLPWDSSSGTSDRRSWLPGRTYNWVSTPDAAFSPGNTNAGKFYSRSIPSLANGLVVAVNGSSSVNGASFLTLAVDQATLTVKLIRDRDDAVLATYTSPPYKAVSTTDEFQANGTTSPIGYIFRLAESLDSVGTDPGVWITTAGQDPRSSHYPADGLTTAPKSDNPTDCKNYVTISVPERFFDRDVTTGTSYNEDVPLFELPRAPIVSLGELQHYFLEGTRPFSVGNSWGSAATLNGIKANALFDRFFFTGLTPAVASGYVWGRALPNATLRVLTAKPNGVPTVLSDLTSATGARSSKFLLQQGAFNINALNREAWIAVLRSGRFVVPHTFDYLDLDPATGSGSDTAKLPSAATGATFFRFPQSAQENFKAETDYTQTTTNAGGGGGPMINVPLFRRGVRALSPVQLSQLAQSVVDLLKQRQAAAGPYGSLEEFLSPSPEFTSAGTNAPISLLEKAIELTGLNSQTALALTVTEPEFSSQWMTQADIVSTLAPVLFCRSDTFLIRSYGETINPVTGAVEATARCEAVVQRMPEPAQAGSPANPTEAEYQTPPGSLGRRFKLISLRWINDSEI